MHLSTWKGTAGIWKEGGVKEDKLKNVRLVAYKSKMSAHDEAACMEDGKLICTLSYEEDWVEMILHPSNKLDMVTWVEADGWNLTLQVDAVDVK